MGGGRAQIRGQKAMQSDPFKETIQTTLDAIGNNLA